MKQFGSEGPPVRWPANWEMTDLNRSDAFFSRVIHAVHAISGQKMCLNQSPFERDFNI